jgi:hypothetical protein
VPELERTIYDYIDHHNTDPKPFVWTKSARDIIRVVATTAIARSARNFPRFYENAACVSMGFDTIA